jgi:peptide/nickel transport system permease protein
MKISLLGRVSVFFFLTLFVVSFGLLLFPSLDPTAFDPFYIGDPEAPTLAHVFGTDDLGRDVLLRCLSGARISLLVGIVSVLISVFLGVWVGLVSGFYGGWVDALLMRFVDIMMGIPTLFLILTIQVMLSPSIVNVIVVIGITSWMGVARMVRSEVLSIRERDFVTAAVARGFSNKQVLFKHILPHTLLPVIVSAMLGMGSAILAESVLSFLGLGVQPPDASWGNMLENSLSFMRDAPWMTLFPGLLITCTVLGLNFIGDDLRAYLNVRERVNARS